MKKTDYKGHSIMVRAKAPRYLIYEKKSGQLVGWRKTYREAKWHIVALLKILRTIQQQ